MNGKQKKIVVIASAISLPLGALMLAYYKRKVIFENCKKPKGIIKQLFNKNYNCEKEEEQNK
tara:strand:+ start:776 stop:961 length:186 start_codon:yes stop_codon:yes gene_type:complete